MKDFEELWDDYAEEQDYLDPDSCIDEKELAEEWFSMGRSDAKLDFTIAGLIAEYNAKGVDGAFHGDHPIVQMCAELDAFHKAALLNSVSADTRPG